MLSTKKKRNGRTNLGGRNSKQHSLKDFLNDRRVRGNIISYLIFIAVQGFYVIDMHYFRKQLIKDVVEVQNILKELEGLAAKGKVKFVK